MDASENTTSLYSLSTLGSAEEYYYDAATEFDTASEDLEDKQENALWELEEGCDLQLLHLLPMELLNRVLSFCSPTTLCHLGRCSTQTLVLTSQSWIWRDLMLRHWGPDIIEGMCKKKKMEFEKQHGPTSSIEGRNRKDSNISMQSDVSSSSMASKTSNISAASTQNIHVVNILPKIRSFDSLMDLTDEINDLKEESWEEWKQWYRDIHRSTRSIRFDVRSGIKELIDHHGLPNTTGAIARMLQHCMPRIASFALRDFLHQVSNINITSFFLRLWNFRGLSVLQMMRLVLGFIRLPRSDSSVTRILEILGQAWWEQNLLTNEDDLDELGLRRGAKNGTNGTNSSPASPASSPPTHGPNPLITNEDLEQRRQIEEEPARAEQGEGEARRRRSSAAARPTTQPIHLAPLAVLDPTNPWEQIQVPVVSNDDDMKARGGFLSSDAVSTFCFAILMLETDQRTSAVKMKMSESAFISQSRGLNAGRNYPREILRETYNSIKFHPLVLFANRVATGRIQVHTSVPRFLFLSSKSTTELRAEVARGVLTVWELDAPNHKPIHSIPLEPASTIVRCDLLGPSWLSTSLGSDENTWNTVEIESLSVLGSSFFKFMVPSEQTQKWFSALHWNIHAPFLDSRAPTS